MEGAVAVGVEGAEAEAEGSQVVGVAVVAVAVVEAGTVGVAPPAEDAAEACQVVAAKGGD